MTLSSAPEGNAVARPGELPPTVYQHMSTTLRVGLVVALVLLAAAIAALVHRSYASPAGGWVSPNPLVRYLDPRLLAAGLAGGAPEAYLTLGVYALIATPVVRVGTGLYSFLRHGERRMGALTAIVLALLLFGLFVVGPLVR